MKLALEIDGHQINSVVIRSLRKSVKFCTNHDSTEETTELVSSLKRVLKLYESSGYYPDRAVDLGYAGRDTDGGYPAFERGSN